MNSSLSRRDALRAAGAVLATGAIAPWASAMNLNLSTRRQAGPNDRLRIGVIGCEGMGSSNMQNLMRFDDVEITALCDVDDGRIPEDMKRCNEKYGRDPMVYKDYRRLLESSDVDAVIIATPDHWHARQFIDACDAGKDSYCEKPISFNVTESVAMAAAQRRTGRIVQVGTWQRSSTEFINAIDYVRTGKLGKVVAARAWIADWFQAGKNEPAEVPSGVDYEMWTGPAPMLPFQWNRFHFNWRWFTAYGGGFTTDWGVHLLDIPLLAMTDGQDLPMPTAISSMGGQWAYPDDDRDTPDTQEAIYRFENPDWVLHWRCGHSFPGRPSHGVEFESADGRTLRVWRGGWVLLDGEGNELPKEEPLPGKDHWREFVDCVKSRKKPSADLQSVAQTTIVCCLANVAYDAGETVRWNKEAMDLVGDAGRESVAYHREYRAPWVTPR